MRKSLTLALYLLVPSLAFGNNCITTSNGSRWLSPAHWTNCGSQYPGHNGSADTAHIENPTTVDVSSAIGVSGPGIAESGSLNQPRLSQTPEGGSLPAGTYNAVYTNVDSAGRQSGPSITSGWRALKAGDTLVIALPPRPAQYASRNIYLYSTTNGAIALYASGVTGTAYKATSAMWNNGRESQSAAPKLPPWTLAIDTPLTLARNVTLTIRGDAIVFNGKSLTLNCGSVFQFDSTRAAEPTNTAYTLETGTDYSGKGPSISTTGSCSSNRWAITSKSGGTPFASLTNIYHPGHVDMNLAYGSISNCGSTASPCWQGSGGSFVIDHVIFSNAGTYETGRIPLARNFSVTNSSWLTDNDALKSGLGAHMNLRVDFAPGNPSGIRVFTGNVFSSPPSLKFASSFTCTNNYFDSALINSSASADNTCTYLFIREPSGNQSYRFSLGGNLSYSYIVTDYWPAPAVTSRTTSATSTTLTDRTQSWTRNAYQAMEAGTGWFVLITGGTGSGQMRSIASNTSNTLTVTRPWTATPDSSSSYQIYAGNAHPHMFNGATGLFTHNICDFTGTTSPGANGECFLGSGTSGVSEWDYNIAVSDGSGLDGNALFNWGDATANNLNLRANHNTAMETGLSAIIGDFTSSTGMIGSYKNNLFWVPSYVRARNLAPYKLADEGHTRDAVAPASADYNACWNCAPGSYKGNGYNLNTSSQLGPHDVNLSSSPNFVDPARKFLTWCQSLGVTGTVPQIIATCRANLMARNNPSAYNPAFNIRALITWVTAGYAPQNPALHNKASDGTDIGAVPYRAAGSSSNH